MSPPNEHLEPTPLEPTPFESTPLEPRPFDAAPGPQPQRDEKTTAPRWVLPALGGLLLLAALVFFVLPALVSPSSDDAPTASSDATANAISGITEPASSPQAAATDDSTPWLDAQAAKLRKEAQDVLAELLELQFSLEERGVKAWAADEFTAAGEAASAGDALYRERQYLEAKGLYQDSLTQLQALSDSIPEQFNRQLEVARVNIEAGVPPAVASALELATLLQPDSPELAAMAQRAVTLEPLMALLDAAAAAENTGELAAAEQSLQQATELDSLHLRARSELERVSQAHLQQRFSDAMSAGYTALDAGRFSEARKEFSRAKGLNVGADEAASALLEVAGAEQASRLTTLKKQGTSLEQSEQWQQAVSAYEKAQKIDGDVLFATQGLDRSRNRARMDKQFRTAITQPERLSDVAVAEATAVLLQLANGITPRGPLLSQQITELETLLQHANTLVPVTLRSDTQTEVIIYKIARLGRFGEHQLTLRPGTYKARGSRLGYRDVLQNFTVSHQGAPEPIVITCTEAI